MLARSRRNSAKGKAGLSTVASADKGGAALILVLEKFMELEDARIGTSVLVQLDYTKPDRRGSVGTIKKRYGTPDYRAFEVQFPDGKTELFWDHQLEETKESSPDPKRRWAFWKRVVAS